MSEGPAVTIHAIRRYRERVDASASPFQASEALLAIAAKGSGTGRPRNWMRFAAAPGVRYVYTSQVPGVCLLVRDATIVTVYSRHVCRQWRNQASHDGARAKRAAFASRKQRPGLYTEEAA